MSVERIVWQGWPALQLRADDAAIVVVPELGAKIVSLTLSGQDADIIWQDETRPLVPLSYGDKFGSFDASGFDECFPTIGECACPDYPWEGVVMPDHGEVWTLPWRLIPDPEAIHTVVHGVRFPYELSRRIRTAPRRFVIEYLARNLSGFPIRYLWSAHPLLALSEGMRVLLPGEPLGHVVFAAGGRLASPDASSGKVRWPWAPGPDGTSVDCSLMGPREWRANDKLCMETPADGWCALFDPSRRRYCAFRMSPEETPFVAICANFGWYPPEGRAAYWVAIEPCTGYPDSLSEAAAAGRARILPPMGEVRWATEIHVGSASTAREVADRVSG